MTPPCSNLLPEQHGEEPNGLHRRTSEGELQDLGAGEDRARLQGAFDGIARIKHESPRIAQVPPAPVTLRPDVPRTFFDSEATTT